MFFTTDTGWTTFKIITDITDTISLTAVVVCHVRGIHIDLKVSFSIKSDLMSASRDMMEKSFICSRSYGGEEGGERGR